MAATAALPYVKSGKLKALAVCGTKRLAALPNAPTVAESGFPEFEWHNWLGFVAPARTPPTVITKLNQEMLSFLEVPQMRQELLEAGYEIAPGSPQDLAALLQKDAARYGQLIRRLGIQPE